MQTLINLQNASYQTGANMSHDQNNAAFRDRSRMSRRQLLAASAGAMLLPSLAKTQEIAMTPKAFVYTEVAISVPFDQVPLQEINAAIRQQLHWRLLRL